MYSTSLIHPLEKELFCQVYLWMDGWLVGPSFVCLIEL